MGRAATVGLLAAVGLLSGCVTRPAPPPIPAGSPVPPPPPPQPAQATSCTDAPGFEAAAGSEVARAEAPLALFGRAESGWSAYAPLVRRAVATPCAPGEPGFAAAVSAWQARNGLAAHGVVDLPTLQLMKAQWQDARPFVRLRAAGVCPDAPSPPHLTWSEAGEGYGGEARALRTDVLAAYRRMVADARRAAPELARDPELLRLFSAYRSPERDAARCAADGNCDGVARATCSAHRTGTAMDIVVGRGPTGRVDSTQEADRKALAASPAYRWLVEHAASYGFTPYAFEPWHWEYVGAPA